MKRTSISLLIVLVVCACDAASQSRQSGIPISSMADWKIVVPAHAIPSEGYAAEELQKFFEEATGIRLSIATEPGGGVGCIYVGPGQVMKASEVGLAYRLPDGRIQRGYNGWNIRRFMMRLCSLQADAGLVPGGNGFHSTHSYLTVAMPWTDAVLDGELDTDLDTSPMDWVDTMPIERMRSMSSPHNWGVAICWMANLNSKVPGRADAAKRIQGQWVWMHDSWRNPYIPQLPVMPERVLDWGVNSEDTMYHPYWRNPYVTSEDEHVLISLWQLPDRVMLGVYNYDREQVKDVTLKIDLEGLNLVPQMPWQEFVGVRDLWTPDQTAPASTLDFHQATLSVPALQTHTLRLIGIRKY